jgi:hypothetical protein
MGSDGDYEPINAALLRRVGAAIPDEIRVLMDAHHETKFVVAGGFVRDVLLGVEPRDIDLYIVGERSDDKATELVRGINSKKKDRESFNAVSRNAITIPAPPKGIPIQVITRWEFLDASLVLNSFDFTVCRASVWGFDGEDLRGFVDRRFWKDAATKTLTYVGSDEPKASMLRMLKFVSRGYRPTLETVVRLMADANAEWIGDRDEYAMHMMESMILVDPSGEDGGFLDDRDDRR